MSTIDRRVHPRQEIVKACKVYRRGTQRYVSAQTQDVSAGGALLEVRSVRPMVPGERLDVGVAWSRSPILLEDALKEARVVRVTPIEGDRHRVAVAFDELEEVAVAA